MKSERTKKLYKNQSAFTLLEVLITLSILVTMVYAISQMIRNGFDIKSSLSQKARATHRVNIAMDTLNRDLSAAFIISSKETVRDGRKNRTIFRVKSGASDTLEFTHTAHRAVKKNAKESDLSFVRYEVRESKNTPGRKHLYRGETPRVPESFDGEIPMSVLAEDIAALKVELWNGEMFKSERWDSTNSDTKDHIPRMLRVNVQTWDEEHELRLGEDVKPSIQYSTVIVLPYALGFPELKQGNSNFSVFR